MARGMRRGFCHYVRSGPGDTSIESLPTSEVGRYRVTSDSRTGSLDFGILNAPTPKSNVCSQPNSTTLLLAMLVRIFGLFGILLGAAYFNEGLAYLGVLGLALSRSGGTFITYVLFVTWDFLFGISLIVAGIGVLFFREWARVMWLGLIPALVVVHLGIIVVNGVFRGGVSINYMVWTVMVITVGVLSWWYLTQDRIRARFSPQQNEPAAIEE